MSAKRADPDDKASSSSVCKEEVRLMRYARMMRLVLLLADRWERCIRQCPNLRYPSKQTTNTRLMARFVDRCRKCFSDPKKEEEEGGSPILVDPALLVDTMVCVCYFAPIQDTGAGEDAEGDGDPGPRFDASIGSTLPGRTVVMLMLASGVLRLFQNIHKVPNHPSTLAFKRLADQLRPHLMETVPSRPDAGTITTLRNPLGLDRILRKALAEDAHAAAEDEAFRQRLKAKRKEARHKRLEQAKNRSGAMEEEDDDKSDGQGNNKTKEGSAGTDNDGGA